MTEPKAHPQEENGATTKASTLVLLNFSLSSFPSLSIM
jgi:hypothetical protein